MKKAILCFAAATLAAIGFASAETTEGYTNFLRQVHLGTGVQLDSSVDNSGERSSFFPVLLGGSRYELYTVKEDPLTSYQLDTKYVSAFSPIAVIRIITEDTTAEVPRTRADRGFDVVVDVDGLLSDLEAPPSARAVNFRRQVISSTESTSVASSNGGGLLGGILDALLGTDGSGLLGGGGLLGTGLLSTLLDGTTNLISQAAITENGEYTYSYDVSEVPGVDRSKLTGIERFSVYSVGDDDYDAEQLDSAHVEIWPVATGWMEGIDNGDIIKTRVPTVIIQLEDLYPSSSTYMQIYEGPQSLGTQGQIVPGSAFVVNDIVPKDHTLTVTDLDDMVGTDGEWTFEVLTETPFGTDRLAHATIVTDRSIEINGSVTSAE